MLDTSIAQISSPHLRVALFLGQEQVMGNEGDNSEIEVSDNFSESTNSSIACSTDSVSDSSSDSGSRSRSKLKRDKIFCWHLLNSNSVSPEVLGTHKNNECDMLFGRTCMEFDVLKVPSVFLPITAKEGDFVLLTGTGAYDVSMQYDFGDGNK